MKINLHIERLVIDGINLEVAERSLVQTSLQDELARLFAAGGVSESLAGGSAVSRISAAAIRLTESTSPSILGEQIAQSIYGGIGK